MRVVPAAVRLLIAAAILAIFSRLILAIGPLPIVPHALAPGPDQLAAKFYSVVWWFAVAALLGAATALISAILVRVRGAKGHRASRFIADALGIAYFLMACVALSAFVFDLPISTVFATSSIVAVILGFALQNTVADLLSGLAMSIEQPFRVGDRIELTDKIGGRVLLMNWRATHLLSVTGDLQIVPNSQLSRGRITNHDAAAAPNHRSFVTVKLGNDESPTRALEVLRAAAMSAEGVLATPLPRVELAAYGDWAIDYKILFYFADWGDESVIASRVLSAVWSHLSWAGIAQPSPRTVMTTGASGAESSASLPSLLKRIDVFAPLDDDARSRLAEKLRIRTLGRGERLMEQGDVGQSLFIVREGILDVFVRDENRVEHTVGRLYPGDYLGEASLLTGAARNAAVEAATGAAVYEIHKDDFEPFLAARHDMADRLASALVARSANRDAALVTANGAAPSRLAHVASQIRAFFRN